MSDETVRIIGGTTSQGRRADDRIEIALGLSALGALTIGCFLVLRPFLSALLWAVILAYTTWPLYERLLGMVGQRRTLAASLMTAFLTACLIVPLILVGSSAAEGIGKLFDVARDQLAQGLPPLPSWITGVPVVGPRLGETWTRISSNAGSAFQMLQPYLATIRDWVIQIGVSVGSGVIEISLSVFVAFFCYRDGRKLARHASALNNRIFGDRAHQVMEVAGSTVRGVVYGVVGTALIQGALAAIGFWIIGFPSALLLGFLSFILALLPLGPPVIWGPVAIWLFSQGEVGWAIFLTAWGLVVVGSSDNVIRPWLISRGSKLTFLPVFLGVVGGAVAFGFLGIFLGPVLLAVGFAVLKSWAQSGARPSETHDPAPSLVLPPGMRRGRRET